MSVQLGYCNGKNSTLNGLAYHKGSEINVAITDFVLLLGHLNDMKNKHFLLSMWKARTLLFNIYELTWDNQLIDILTVPKSMLPEVRSSSEIYGHTYPEYFFGLDIPIAAAAGDHKPLYLVRLVLKKGWPKIRMEQAALC